MANKSAGSAVPTSILLVSSKHSPGSSQTPLEVNALLQQQRANIPAYLLSNMQGKIYNFNHVNIEKMILTAI